MTEKAEGPGAGKAHGAAAAASGLDESQFKARFAMVEAYDEGPDASRCLYPEEWLGEVSRQVAARRLTEQDFRLAYRLAFVYRHDRMPGNEKIAAHMGIPLHAVAAGLRRLKRADLLFFTGCGAKRVCWLISTWWEA